MTKHVDHGDEEARRTIGRGRSPKWPKIEKAFRAVHPQCVACIVKSVAHVQIHHRARRGDRAIVRAAENNVTMVCYARDMAKVPTRKVPYDILVADYASGLSQEQVAAKRGVSSSVVHQALKLAKYPARPANGQKGPDNPRWRGGTAGYYQRNKLEILAKAKLKTENKQQYDKQRYLNNRERRAAQAKAWYRSQDPNVLREKQRQKHLRRLYGLTIEEYNGLVNKQNGVCAICTMPPRGKNKENKLHVDHDHTTKAVRGLLCMRCNLHLAWMELFEAEAKAYLARATANASPKRGAGFVRPKQAKRAPYAEDRPDAVTLKKSYGRADICTPRRESMKNRL